MGDALPTDPFGLFRTWLGEWEKLANKHGGEWLARPEVARAIEGMNSAKLQTQGLSDEAMGKLLAAANMPSKADIEDIGARLAAIESTLARIEAHQRDGGDASVGRPRPKPKRIGKPVA